MKYAQDAASEILTHKFEASRRVCERRNKLGRIISHRIKERNLANWKIRTEFYNVKFGAWNFAILNSAPGILQWNFATKFCLVELCCGFCFCGSEALNSALKASRYAASQNSISHSQLKFHKKFYVEFYAEFCFAHLRGYVKFRAKFGILRLLGIWRGF